LSRGSAKIGRMAVLATGVLVGLVVEAAIATAKRNARAGSTCTPKSPL
jgi:hypothetical protein